MVQDEKIIALLLQRSELAIEALREKYERLLRSVASNFLQSSEDIEECINDTYLGIWNSIPPHVPQYLSGYLCKVLRNLAVSRYRSSTAQKRSCGEDVPLEELQEILPCAETVEDQIQGKLLAAYLSKFLEKQNKENRVIFMRRYWFCDDYAAIAARTGLSAKNVSVRLTRMRKQLKRYLQEEDVL